VVQRRDYDNDNNNNNNNVLLHRIAPVDAERNAGSLDDVRSQCAERNLNGWNHDPDERDCSVDETLLRAQLQNNNN